MLLVILMMRIIFYIIFLHEANKPKGGFLSMLLGTLGASLFENLLTCKVVTKVGEGTIRAGQDFYYRLIL